MVLCPVLPSCGRRACNKCLDCFPGREIRPVGPEEGSRRVISDGWEPVGGFALMCTMCVCARLTGIGSLGSLVWFPPTACTSGAWRGPESLGSCSRASASRRLPTNNKTGGQMRHASRCRFHRVIWRVAEKFDRSSVLRAPYLWPDAWKCQAQSRLDSHTRASEGAPNCSHRHCRHRHHLTAYCAFFMSDF